MWNDSWQKSFEYLKEHLVSALILSMSQAEGKFILDVDAIDSVWSSSSNNPELSSLIYRLKEYCRYLLGRHFIVWTDHAALSYFCTAKDLIIG